MIYYIVIVDEFFDFGLNFIVSGNVYLYDYFFNKVE